MANGGRPASGGTPAQGLNPLCDRMERGEEEAIDRRRGASPSTNSADVKAVRFRRATAENFRPEIFEARATLREQRGFNPWDGVPPTPGLSPFARKRGMSPLPEYAELHCLSNFSFLRGASHAEELVAQAKELGYAALAITDECSLAGVVRAHTAVKKIGGGIKLLIGAEVRLDDGPRLGGIARNRAGYGRLSRLITRGERRV